jgi:hypothetical protein
VLSTGLEGPPPKVTRAGLKRISAYFRPYWPQWIVIFICVGGQAGLNVLRSPDGREQTAITFYRHAGRETHPPTLSADRVTVKQVVNHCCQPLPHFPDSTDGIK